MVLHVMILNFVEDLAAISCLASIGPYCQQIAVLLINYCNMQLMFSALTWKSLLSRKPVEKYPMWNALEYKVCRQAKHFWHQASITSLSLNHIIKNGEDSASHCTIHRG
jgi:hypothetical protein